MNKYGRLARVINKPKGAYFYLPKAATYSIFAGYSVVPICDIGEGDSYYLLLFNDAERKIVLAEIEQDEILRDYGLDVNHLICDILISFYEVFSDDDFAKDQKGTINKIASVGYAMGLKLTESQKLAERVYDADTKGEDRFGAGEEDWKKINYGLIFET